ncbi:acetate--CoA ligase [Marinicellulosiphila megalodicopiae]|uniref:acetate--CoA ligase n=1 Tax=Marinicellulosiphila megalodicopiae TaxID=2724896 RepID=UPI003BAF69EA
MKNIYPILETAKQKTLTNNQQYIEQYEESISHNDFFWQKQASRIDWIQPFSQVKDVSFKKEDCHIKWFYDGTLNVSYNCIDRHLKNNANQTAIIWEGDDPKHDKHISYQTLHDEVCKLSNGLTKLGVKKGDRVTIYMPMIVEAAYAMLACTRIGAIHSVVFGGFSPEALAGRIIDCQSDIVITADQGLRGGKTIDLKANVDAALKKAGCEIVRHVVCVAHTKIALPEQPIDIDYQTLVYQQSTEFTPVEMNAEDPLFVLYTSGSTGKPKGVLHTTGGYLTYASYTHEKVFDYKIKEGEKAEVYWCAADVGWITGHSYILYGPLSNGATTVMFEGVPNYPTIGRMGEIVDKHQINILYTAPTAIRLLMAQGKDATQSSKRDSLRLLGSVGEPINPEAWHWYYHEFGESCCPIVDTWWQTETGGFLIAPLPGATNLKPGSATRPLCGIVPELVDSEGKVLEGAAEGNLVISQSWPGQMRSLYGDHQRFIDTYFSTYPNKYFTGDGAKRDEDGYFWITGRVDDVLNVSGHRLGTAEIESALVAHPSIAEAAVVGFGHDIKGQGIYVYVSAMAGTEINETLTAEVKNWVRSEIGPFASADFIQWTTGLPKTRSGKIMRRILRKIADNEFDQLGDTSTLADPCVVDQLIEGRLNRSKTV